MACAVITKDKISKNEFLELDSSKSEEKRLENKLLCTKDNKKTLTTRPDIKKLKESSILSRVKNFLPEINKANTKLASELEKGNAEQFDIENIGDSENVIELDLSLVPDCGEESDSEDEEILSDDLSKPKLDEDDGSGSNSTEQPKKLINEITP